MRWYGGHSREDTDLTTQQATSNPVPAEIRTLITAAVIEAGYSRTGATARLLESVREILSTESLHHDRSSAWTSAKTTAYRVIDADGVERTIVVRFDGGPDGADMDAWPSMDAYKARSRR